MARFAPKDPGEDVEAFLREYHLATLSIVKADGTPHVTPIGFTYEPERSIARVITWAGSWKAKHVSSLGVAPAAICSVDGRRWLTLAGSARITDDPDAVAEAVRRYAARYRQPKERADRVVIELAVASIVGNM